MRVRSNIPLLGLIVAMVVLSAVGLIGYRTTKLQGETAGWVEHTYLVIEQLDRILMSIHLAESAARGFALNREEHLRREVEPAIATARDAYSHARELTGDSRRQQDRVRQLGPKLERRIELLEEYLARVGTGGSTQVLSEALRVSSEIRSLASEMVNHEQVLLNQRVRERSDQTASTLRVLGIGFASSVVVVLAAFGLVHRESLQISKLHVVHAGRDLGDVTISAGVAVYPLHGVAADDLVRAADTVLYTAKREGRDRVIVAA